MPDRATNPARLIAIVEAFEEEELIGECVRAAFDAGVDEVHVWDGAFVGFADHYVSADRTFEQVWISSGTWHPAEGFYADRGEKIAAMLHGSGAVAGDSLLILDADERLVRTCATGIGPVRDALVLLVNTGPNDLPGVRKPWPDGDYSETPYPAPRVLAWTPDLGCELAGIYTRGGRRVRFFEGRRPIKPALPGLLIEHRPHLRNEAAVEAKRRYYVERELPQREQVKARMRRKP